MTGNLKAVRKNIADEVLAQFDEPQLWAELLQHGSGPDAANLSATESLAAAKLRFEVLKYLTDRRDGKPRESVDLSSGSQPIEVRISTYAHSNGDRAPEHSV